MKIQDTHTFEPVIYPVGINKGYKAYVDVDSRRDYWDKYLELLWNVVYPELKVKYWGNWDEFYDDSIRYLETISIEFLTPKKKESQLFGENIRLFSSVNHAKTRLNLEDDFPLLEDNTKQKCCNIL